MIMGQNQGGYLGFCRLSLHDHICASLHQGHATTTRMAKKEEKDRLFSKEQEYIKEAEGGQVSLECPWRITSGPAHLLEASMKRKDYKSRGDEKEDKFEGK